MPTGNVVHVSPAKRCLLRRYRQLPLQILDKGTVHWAGIARPVHESRLDNNQWQARLDHRISDLIMGKPFGPVIFAEMWTIITIRLVGNLSVRVRKDRHGTRIDALWNTKFFH